MRSRSYHRYFVFYRNARGGGTWYRIDPGKFPRPVVEVHQPAAEYRWPQ